MQSWQQTMKGEVSAEKKAQVTTTPVAAPA